MGSACALQCHQWAIIWPHVLNDGLVDIFVHEPREWREAPHGEQLHIARIPVAAFMLVRGAGFQVGLLLGVTDHQVHQLSTMRDNVSSSVTAQTERCSIINTKQLVFTPDSINSWSRSRSDHCILTWRRNCHALNTAPAGQMRPVQGSKKKVSTWGKLDVVPIAGDPLIRSSLSSRIEQGNTPACLQARQT